MPRYCGRHIVSTAPEALGRPPGPDPEGGPVAPDLTPREGSDGQPSRYPQGVTVESVRLTERAVQSHASLLGQTQRVMTTFSTAPADLGRLPGFDPTGKPGAQESSGMYQSAEAAGVVEDKPEGSIPQRGGDVGFGGSHQAGRDGFIHRPASHGGHARVIRSGHRAAERVEATPV